jgi:tetrahydromethanopterin S-methyltransferase subunit F
MFNKIKNFFNRSKKAIDNKCNEIYCKAQTAVANAKAEFYIDKTVGIIICVVVGVLLMGIVYAFVKNNIQTRLDTEIGNLWDYAG